MTDYGDLISFRQPAVSTSNNSSSREDNLVSMINCEFVGARVPLAATVPTAPAAVVVPATRKLRPVTQNDINTSVRPSRLPSKSPTLLKELREFINRVSADGQNYNKLLIHVTITTNNWIDEVDNVCDQTTDLIVSSSIVNQNFKKYGAQLCTHLYKNIKNPICKDLFKNGMVKSCQFWIRNLIARDSEVPQFYAEDLTVFLGEVFKSICDPVLGQALIALLKTILERPTEGRLISCTQVLNSCYVALETVDNNVLRVSDRTIPHILSQLTLAAYNLSGTSTAHSIVQEFLIKYRS
ncbi:hypothetical protein GZH46_00572 [Fragariocoptes setiger]|uniref:Uncharacterized protein n=1 Tax=Fragariocoptes setiger TaxID=1670756 RepID=A0ABQ7SC94_9ACAR|nr:hypothetical protein GZH46_00572 [Fragariocoptes setiger]